MIKNLFDGFCVLRFEYPDTSVIECITTLKPELLAMYGYTETDGLVDFTNGKIIPGYMYEYFSDLRSGTEKHLLPLDDFFDIGRCLSW